MLVLFDTYETKEWRWIPAFLHLALQYMKSILSTSEDRRLNQALCDLWRDFKGGNTLCGRQWEALFVIILIFRCIAAASCSVLDLDGIERYSISYNANGAIHDLSRCSTLHDLLSRVKKPTAYPHVDVFYPPHPSFEKIDAFALVWKDKDSPCIMHCYQLKQRKAVPSTPAVNQNDLPIDWNVVTTPLGHSNSSNVIVYSYLV